MNNNENNAVFTTFEPAETKKYHQFCKMHYAQLE